MGEQKASMEQRHHQDIQEIGSYIFHLSRVYQRIIDEDNPFTRENILDVHTPEGVLGLVHDSIFYLGNELTDEQTGDLEISNRFRVGDLDKLGDLRKNTQRDLIDLLKDRYAVESDRMAEDYEVYNAVALGFVEISPEELTMKRGQVKRAEFYLRGYNNSSILNRIKRFKDVSQNRWISDKSRTLCFNYSLTPLGKSAVLPINRKYVGLAEFERVFDKD